MRVTPAASQTFRNSANSITCRCKRSSIQMTTASSRPASMSPSSRLYSARCFPVLLYLLAPMELSTYSSMMVQPKRLAMARQSCSWRSTPSPLPSQSRLILAYRPARMVICAHSHRTSVCDDRRSSEHSMNYRSVMAIGRTRPVTDPGEKEAALRALVEHIVPGRSDEVRGGDSRELAATAVLALPLAEVSAKVRTGPPKDDEPDYDLPYWAGVLPLALEPGRPVPDPRLTPGIPVPPHVTGWSRNGGPRPPAGR